MSLRAFIRNLTLLVLSGCSLAYPLDDLRVAQSTGSGTASGSCGQLPAGTFFRENPANQRCYWIIAQPAGWAQQGANCSQNGGAKSHLGTLGASGELSWVTGQGFFKGSTWVGATLAQGKWTWFDGEPWMNPPWAIGEPSSGECAFVDEDQKFGTDDCSVAHAALCERDP